MKKISLKQLGLKLTLLAMLGLPGLADAQSFTYNQYGDVLAGFRKTTPNAGLYELVVDLGSVTNFLNLTIGTTINITNYATKDLTNAFTDTTPVFGHLQWSVFAGSAQGSSTWPTPLGTFPKDTIWFTLPATNATTQSQVPNRDSTGAQGVTKNLIEGVGGGALYLADNTGASNTTFWVRESVSYYGAPGTIGYTLSSYIDDSFSITNSDFGSSGAPLAYNVENETPASFASAQRIDFYQLCPSGLTDPISSSTSATYYLGYFLLNPNGSMTFTRAAQSMVPPPPVAGFSGTPTAGFAPLQVAFTDASTGSITNWLWNFGDGQSVTNATNASVNHTYASAGSYTVTLTVSGAGGANADTRTGYIVASSTPTISTVTKSGGSLVMSGTGNPAGVQYRILTSTNVSLPLATWTPVTTNNFLPDGSYSYTNSTTQQAGFFRLVSP
jgi:PKD repeat protein